MSEWPRSYKLRPTSAELAGRYALPLSGAELHRLQLMSRAASTAAPAGLTAYFIATAEMKWLGDLLRQVEETKP